MESVTERRPTGAYNYLVLFVFVFSVETLIKALTATRPTPILTALLPAALGLTVTVFIVAFAVAWLISLKNKQRRFHACLWAVVIVRLLIYLGERGSA